MGTEVQFLRKIDASQYIQVCKNDRLFVGMLKKENLYHYLNEAGEPETVNIDTGELIRYELPLQELDDYVVASVSGRRAFVHKNTIVPTRQPVVQYSSLVAEDFCARIVEGKKMLETCTDLGISYATFCKWRRQNHEFSEMVEQAKRDRAELLFERLLDVAQTTEADSDAISLGRLKADIYKHVAAVGNEKFNAKTKIEADHRVGVVALDTGIDKQRTVDTEEDRLFRLVVERNNGKTGEKEE